MPVLVRMPSPEPALACIPSVLQAASGSPFIGCSAATQRIAINPKNNQCVCRLYEEEVRLCNARGGIDENSLRAFTLSMKGTPLLLGRGGARGRGGAASRLQRGSLQSVFVKHTVKFLDPFARASKKGPRVVITLLARRFFLLRSSRSGSNCSVFSMLVQPSSRARVS